jgi:hypothetical protein
MIGTASPTVAARSNTMPRGWEFAIRICVSSAPSAPPTSTIVSNRSKSQAEMTDETTLRATADIARLKFDLASGRAER